MHVLATAGHVDHGKSTIVRALTGTDPDRWSEEHRRGLTIDLGFAWTELAGDPLAVVDVPGHERFVANMLAGVGPVPAVLFVVAADEGWMPQSEEHLAALDAFGVRHGVLAVTKVDKCDPDPVIHEARERISRTTLGHVPAVTLDGRSGAGLDRLRGELAGLIQSLPAADHAADVRLWVDRVFTVRGAGTVLTGTLGAGSVRVGEEFVLASTGQRVTVRGMQSLGTEVGHCSAVARVALNLRGVPRERPARGDALLSPGAWIDSATMDVRLRFTSQQPIHSEMVLHIGSASVPVRTRLLGPETARLSLSRPLPLRAGDTGLLRDPGAHSIIAGAEVLDVDPPALRRSGAARARATELETAGPEDVARAYVRRHGVLAERELLVRGMPVPSVPIAGWVVDERVRAGLPQRIRAEFERWSASDPLADGMPAEELRKRLGLPAELLADALAGTPLTLSGGRVRGNEPDGLPTHVHEAVRKLRTGLDEHPFRAPEAGHLAELGLGTRELAGAVRHGELIRVAEAVYLAPDALPRAAGVLSELSQPFTVSDARRALDTTRRVAVPLLELLDADGSTERVDERNRVCRTTPE